MKLAPLIAIFGALSLACALTDVKGDTCEAADMFQTEEGDRYCRDPAAPGECEDVVDGIFEAFVYCADGAFTEDELRDELAAQGVSVDCDEAVATSTELDTCYEDLADPTCEDGLAVISEACKGAVLAEP